MNPPRFAEATDADGFDLNVTGVCEVGPAGHVADGDGDDQHDTAEQCPQSHKPHAPEIGTALLPLEATLPKLREPAVALTWDFE